MIEFKNSNKPGRIGVFTPFNGDFVKELKSMIPSAKWNGEGWFFDEISQNQVEKLVEKYFPSEDALQLVRIEWELSRDDPQVDGISLASISRDYWNWRKNCPIQFKVIENDATSGGSRKSPGLYGRLVIEAKIRPDANISPEPKSVAVIEDLERRTQ